MPITTVLYLHDIPNLHCMHYGLLHEMMTSKSDQIIIYMTFLLYIMYDIKSPQKNSMEKLDDLCSDIQIETTWLLCSLNSRKAHEIRCL